MCICIWYICMYVYVCICMCVCVRMRAHVREISELIELTNVTIQGKGSDHGLGVSANIVCYSKDFIRFSEISHSKIVSE